MANKMALQKAYEGWDTQSHLQTFNIWNNQSNFHFNFAYGCFAEQIYLGMCVSQSEKPSILDVGCATGTTYRFLRNNWSKTGFSYRGVDLSGPAIERARSLYPGVNFTRKGNEKLLEFVGGQSDIVYSRDTILHQAEPFSFLRELLDVSGKHLVLRLRTRDDGPTEWDIETSCQMHYDSFWMPYIVINTEELIAFLKAYPRVAKVTLNRSYEILGGQNYRYLPKSLYFSRAGGAETSLMIELSEDARRGEAEIVYEQRLEGQAFLRRYRFKRLAYRAFDRIVSRRSR